MAIIGMIVLMAGLTMIYMGFTNKSIGQIMKAVFGSG